MFLYVSQKRRTRFSLSGGRALFAFSVLMCHLGGKKILMWYLKIKPILVSSNAPLVLSNELRILSPWNWLKEEIPWVRCDEIWKLWGLQKGLVWMYGGCSLHIDTHNM